MLRLQQFGIKDSQYERPALKWVCGRAAEGHPCAQGPDEGGECQATLGDCFPRRDGARWKCTRDQFRGGKCGVGPMPDGLCSQRASQCLPVLNLRRKRGGHSRWVVLLSLSVLVILLASSARMKFVSPGDLSFQHSSGTENCKNCHSSSTDSPAGWVATAFSPHSQEKESNLCSECHKFGDYSLKAHSLDPDRLERIREEFQGREEHISLSLFSPLRLADSKIDGLNESVACASCHKEHRGQQADITTLSNPQCQSCHLLKFDNFSENHPDISDFAFQRRSRIIFDHLSHKGKHHPKEDTDFACADCHKPDAHGEAMLAPDFETGCSLCHGARIKGKGANEESINVLTVPALDVQFLIENDVAIGEWPEDADSEITPFMALLLTADSEFKAIAPVLKSIDDLSDLSEADNTQLSAVKQLAWAVKRLLFDLRNGGHRAIETRLTQIFGDRAPTVQQSSITGGLSAGVVDEALQNWFPELKSEMEKYTPDSQPPSRFTKISEKINENNSTHTDEAEIDFDVLDESFGLDDDFSDIDLDEEEESESENSEADGKITPISGAKWVRTGGWYRSDFSLFYRPKGHADEFVRTWMTVTSPSAKALTTPEANVFKLLSNPKAPGYCAKCHSIDKKDDDALTINWHAKRPDPAKHPFTTFSHQPHFSLIKSKGCITCHSWNENPTTEHKETYKSHDPSQYSGNFLGLKKAACAECHTEKLAGDDCQSCHRYHVGFFPDLMGSIKTR